MQQGAVELDEAELQRRQPAHVGGVHRLEQGIHGRLPLAEAQGIGSPLAPVSTLGQQLVLPPAVEALRFEFAAARLLQPVQQGIALPLRADHIPQHKQCVHPPGVAQIRLDGLIGLQISAQSTDQGPACHQRSHTWLASSARSAYSKPWRSRQAKIGGSPASTMARQVRSTSYGTSRISTAFVSSW